MQRLTRNVPDDKVTFFKELIKNLGFIQTDKNIIRLTSKQEWLVKQELEKLKETPDNLLDWEEEYLDPDTL